MKIGRVVPYTLTAVRDILAMTRWLDTELTGAQGDAIPFLPQRQRATCVRT